MTTVTRFSSIDGNWKQRDFPPPVAIIPDNLSWKEYFQSLVFDSLGVIKCLIAKLQLESYFPQVTDKSSHILHLMNPFDVKRIYPN